MDHSLRVKHQVRPGDELERKIEARTWLRVLGAIFLRAYGHCIYVGISGGNDYVNIW